MVVGSTYGSCTKTHIGFYLHQDHPRLLFVYQPASATQSDEGQNQKAAVCVGNKLGVARNWPA